MMRGVLFALTLAMPFFALAQSAEEEAGDVAEVDKDRVGPLRERVRPVSGHVFLKKGRFEVSPGPAITIRDAFFTKYILGLALSYHLSESFAFGAFAGYSLPIVSGAAQICTTTGTTTRGCRLPTEGELNGRAPGKILLVGGVDLQWAPIYGKLSLIAEKFVNFDMYAAVSPTAVQYLGPRGSVMTVGGAPGLGMRFVINRWMALRVELRDLLYVEDAEGGSQLRQQIYTQFGFSMFFPTTFQEG